MRSGRPGKGISEVEVTNVSKHGFWLFIHKREVFLPFEHFPWFWDVPIRKLFNVELPQPHHLYWPDLDIDIAMESIDHPDRFPLISKVWPNNSRQRTRHTAPSR
ncbi:MAG: DUF2442 domain-containing protein [Candidatus Entotheonellia bacterium]